MSKPITLLTTERDLDVLSTLGACRFATTPQLATLWFPTEEAASARLRRLHASSLVTKVFMPVRPYDRRSCTVWALSRKGSRALEQTRPEAERRTVSESERRSGLFLDHTLRRNDLRLALTTLDRDLARDVGLLCWKQVPEEVEFRAPSEGWNASRVRVVPDASVTLQHGGQAHAFDVEIDMGTVAPKRMADRYAAYWRSRRTRALAFGGCASHRVLTLTTTKPRLDRLRAAARAALPGATSRLFWFALLAEAADIKEPAKLLGPVWHTSAVDDDQQPLF